MILANQVLNTIGSIVSWIFLYLDFIVYWLMKNLYILFFKLSQYSLLSKSANETFISRIWMFIGIIMLFKMAISLINYMVNPDDFSNEKTGFGKIVQRVMVSLVLLAFCQQIFTYMYQIQGIIIDKNIIGKVVLGDTESVGNAGSDEQALNLVDGVFSGFFQHPENADITYKIRKLNFADLHQYIGDDGITYIYGLDVVGGLFIDYVLLIFCFDVAVRSIKLSLYQMLAPIPIIMYIDPKKGDDSLKNYGKAVLSTWMSLLIRVAILYFIILIINIVFQNGGNYAICKIVDGQLTDTCDNTDAFVELFIIFGLFLFAKEAPKLIQEVTGIKLDGGAGGIFSWKARVKDTAFAGLSRMSSEDSAAKQKKATEKRQDAEAHPLRTIRHPIKTATGGFIKEKHSKPERTTIVGGANNGVATPTEAQQNVNNRKDTKTNSDDKKSINTNNNQNGPTSSNNQAQILSKPSQVRNANPSAGINDPGTSQQSQFVAKPVQTVKNENTNSKDSNNVNIPFSKNGKADFSGEAKKPSEEYDYYGD